MSRISANTVEVSLEAETSLGRANGNVYYRRPGMDNVHDGQVMVRLKKKRFVLLDYSFAPSSVEINEAMQNPNVSIPTGAGVLKCRTCNFKIGVPVCLYDSDPTEPTSLYIRSGLCFTCQRRLNEKRRTERKRSPESGTADTKSLEPKQQNSSLEPCIIYTIGPVRMKKVKHNPKHEQSAPIVEVKDDAIIINGTIDGMKSFKEGYSFQEIGTDLFRLCQEISTKASKLVSTSTQITAAAAVASMGSPHKNGDLAFLNNDDDNNYEASVDVTSNLNMMHPKEAANSFKEITSSSLDEVDQFYQCTFQSLHHAIFLLSQWKISWDAAHRREITPSLPFRARPAACPSFQEIPFSNCDLRESNDDDAKCSESDRGQSIPVVSLKLAENGQTFSMLPSDPVYVEFSGLQSSDNGSESLISEKYDEV